MQSGGKVGDGEAGGGEPLGVQFDADHGLAIPDRVDVARAGDAFELAQRGARDLAELMGAERGISAPEGQCDDRHVIDALGLDQGLQDADARGTPVLIRIHGVVEPHDGVVAMNADLRIERSLPRGPVSTPNRCA